MDKPIKNSVAYVIYTPNRSEFLIVQRPDNDEDLPGLWGLPAGSLKEGESFEDAVIRSGRQKLGVELKVNKMINEGEVKRKDYVLHMKEYEAEVIEGKPRVPQILEGVTQYQTWRWGISEDLKSAAEKGSLCCRLYLESIKR